MLEIYIAIRTFLKNCYKIDIINIKLRIKIAIKTI